MKIDMKSMMIGILLVVMMFLCIASTYGLRPGKYSIACASNNENLYVAVINTENGRMCVLRPTSSGWKMYGNSTAIIPADLR